VIHGHDQAAMTDKRRDCRPLAPSTPKALMDEVGNKKAQQTTRSNSIQSVTLFGKYISKHNKTGVLDSEIGRKNA
jgi:hypothetical protein